MCRQLLQDILIDIFLPWLFIWNGDCYLAFGLGLVGREEKEIVKQGVHLPLLTSGNWSIMPFLQMFLNEVGMRIFISPDFSGNGKKKTFINSIIHVLYLEQFYHTTYENIVGQNSSHIQVFFFQSYKKHQRHYYIWTSVGTVKLYSVVYKHYSWWPCFADISNCFL